MVVRQILPSEEIKVRRFLMKDPDFALHRNLKDYFLSGSDGFGVLVAESGKIEALACYSIMLEKGLSHIHYWCGDLNLLDSIKAHLGYPCQVFLREGKPVGWTKVLDVTPGLILDHPAYSGVFSRTVPRFAGSVYERV